MYPGIQSNRSGKRWPQNHKKTIFYLTIQQNENIVICGCNFILFSCWNHELNMIDKVILESSQKISKTDSSHVRKANGLFGNNPHG